MYVYNKQGAKEWTNMDGNSIQITDIKPFVGYWFFASKNCYWEYDLAAEQLMPPMPVQQKVFPNGISQAGWSVNEPMDISDGIKLLTSSNVIRVWAWDNNKEAYITAFYENGFWITSDGLTTFNPGQAYWFGVANQASGRAYKPQIP